MRVYIRYFLPGPQSLSGRMSSFACLLSQSSDGRYSIASYCLYSKFYEFQVESINSYPRRSTLVFLSLGISNQFKIFTMRISITISSLLGYASAAIVWDGRFNGISSSTDLNNWSWSNQVGPYQYYIVRPSSHNHQFTLTDVCYSSMAQAQ